MISYILRRLLLMIPTLLGITLVVFVVMALSPGGISAQSLVDGFGMKPQEKQALQEYYNRRYGLDDPAPVQYLRWLNNVSPVGFLQDQEGEYTEFSFSKGSDLGESIRYGRPVLDLVGERVPVTLLLNVLSIPLIYAIALMVGVRAATDRGGRFDVTSNVVMLGLWSIPSMLTGVILIGLFASDQFWHWFPTSGLSERAAIDMPFLPHWGNRIWHLVLPVICLSYGGFAFLARLTRSSMLENLQADFARTARAKGVSEQDVIWTHVFRNSLLPLITVSASLLPSLLAGSVIVESIFSIDGMGKLAVEAVKGRDRELVLSITFISGLLTLVSYLIADLLYAIADPR
ncbi:unnamed protein product, partial [Cyprideis torosa]